MCSNDLSGLPVALSPDEDALEQHNDPRENCSDLLSIELANSGNSQWSKVHADVLKKTTRPELHTRRLILIAHGFGEIARRELSIFVKALFLTNGCLPTPRNFIYTL